MKNIWKWILGVLLVLVVVAAVGVAAFVWRNRMGVAFINRSVPFAQSWDNRPIPRGNDGWNNVPMPMMRGRGGFGLGFFGPFLFLGGLVKLAFFGALLYGAYWLGKRNARVVVNAPPATSEPAPKETSA